MVNFLSITLLLLAPVAISAIEPLNQRLLVVSFDGFRRLYLNSTLLPWFNEFGATGVISDKIQSIFPSDTFPNHWSIATGMYAETHGIVANSFYDPNLGKTFYMDTLDEIFWNQSEPIWQTARQQGTKQVSVYFWPGSATQFDDGKGTPNYYPGVYDTKVPFEVRIDQTISWLKNEKVDLAMLYFNEPDSVGHNSGPDSVKTNAVLRELDWYLSYLLLELDKADLGSDKFNVLICADHGMINVTQRLWVGTWVDMNSIEPIVAQGAVTQIRPKPGMDVEVYNNLTKGSQADGRFKVYWRRDVPEEYHYSNNDRIADIVVICKLGVYMSKSANSQGQASHGFDPKEAPMQPVFMARGPAFKTGGYKAAKMFETKDIYAIMTHVVGITPAKVNASLTNVMDIFADPNNGSTGAAKLMSFTLILTTFLVSRVLLH